VTAGYAGAMSYDDQSLRWQFTAAFLVLGLGLWAAWQTVAGGGQRRRLAAMTLWVAFWVFAFKEGFVRHDGGHAIVFFGTVLGGFCAFRWERGQRTAAVLGVAGLLALALAAQSQSLTGDFSPVRNVRAAWRDFRNVALSSHRHRIMEQARQAIIASE